MTCAWCGEALPAGIRADAVCCSKRCRQARHRFNRDVGKSTGVVDGHARRLAYADPPYPGRSKKYYGNHPDYAGEVDHAELVASLSADYDAWALSTAADCLQDVLALCPPGARVAAWARGERPHKWATAPINGWEPVIYFGRIRRAARPPATTRRVEQLEQVPGRAGELRRVAEDLNDVSRPPGGDVSCGSVRRVDSLVYGAGVRTTEDGRVIGAKPAAFWGWMFNLLAASPIDSFTDIFPASGAGDRAWATYTDPSRSTAVPA